MKLRGKRLEAGQIAHGEKRGGKREPEKKRETQRQRRAVSQCLPPAAARHGAHLRKRPGNRRTPNRQGLPGGRFGRIGQRRIFLPLRRAGMKRGAVLGPGTPPRLRLLLAKPRIEGSLRINLKIVGQELRRGVEDQLASAKHQGHVGVLQAVHRMGDAHHGEPLLPRQLAQQRGERGFRRRIKRLPGFVAKQEPRGTGQRHRHRQAPPLLGRQCAATPVGFLGQPGFLQEGAHRLPAGSLAQPGHPQAQSDFHMFGRRQQLVAPGGQKRTLREVSHGRADARRPSPNHLAKRRPPHSGEELKQRAFAGTLRSRHHRHRSRRKRGRHIAKDYPLLGFGGD